MLNAWSLLFCGRGGDTWRCCTLPNGDVSCFSYLQSLSRSCFCGGLRFRSLGICAWNAFASVVGKGYRSFGAGSTVPFCISRYRSFQRSCSAHSARVQPLSGRSGTSASPYFCCRNFACGVHQYFNESLRYVRCGRGADQL